MSKDPLEPAKRQPGQRRQQAAGELGAGRKSRKNGHDVSGKPNALTGNETYASLREEERVVMRHQIVLNIDSFKAANEGFDPRPQQRRPALRETGSPFMSVIIPNYNGLAYLKTALSALQRQTFQDFEAIVVDDASTDDTVPWVGANCPHVRLIVNRRNLGFAVSCNAAADAAYGRVLVLLNNDTEPEPDWLLELAKAVCTQPYAAIFGSKILLFDARDTLHTTGDLLGIDGVPRNRGVWEKDHGQYDQAQSIFSGCGGAVAYRKDVWQALGGFDSDFWMYLEDVDFGFRAQLLGWNAVFVPKARVYHHLSATGGGEMASYFVGRNTIWNLLKNMPRGLLMRNLPQLASAQLGITVDALRHIRGAVARARLRGQIAGIVGAPRQLHKRRLIQVRRMVDDRELRRRLVQQ